MKKIHSLVIILFLAVCSAYAQKPVAAFVSDYDTICFYEPVTFTDQSANNPTAWKWTFQGAFPSSSTDQNPIVFYANGSGGDFDVSLAVFNSSGGDSVTIIKYIHVFPEIRTPTIIERGDSLFCSTDPSYLSYQWYDSTMLIPGATDTFLVINHQDAYNVQVVDTNCCTIAVGVNIIILEGMASSSPSSSSLRRPAPCNRSVGIINYFADDFVSLFPNPANNKINISLKTLSRNAAIKLRVTNVLGQTFYQSEFLPVKSGPQSEIDISFLPAGIYFAEVVGEKGGWVGRFVKE